MLNESDYSQEIAYAVPVLDRDGDGIPADEEINTYGTDPTRVDTDGDGINDGEELDYWGTDWNADDEGDGIINILDADSDNDGYSDGFELKAGFDPADNSSFPPISFPHFRIHLTETVHYIAWEPSSGNIGGVTFEIDTTGNKVTHQLHTINFNQPYACAPIFLSDMQTTNGRDPANVRWQNHTGTSVQVQIHEEQSRNEETRHLRESVGYMVFFK